LADYLNIITTALGGSAKRSELISNNIANASTPGYKRKDIDFQSALKREIDSSAGNNNGRKSSSLAMTRTHSGHISKAGSRVVENSSFKVNENERSYRNDENSVDIEVEMAEMAKNTIYYNVMSNRAKSYFSNLNKVIQEGGR